MTSNDQDFKTSRSSQLYNQKVAFNDFSDASGKKYDIMYLSQLTIITGVFNTGKTTLLHELLKVIRVNTDEKILFINEYSVNIAEIISKHNPTTIVIEEFPEKINIIELIKQGFKIIININSLNYAHFINTDIPYCVYSNTMPSHISRRFNVTDVKDPYMIILNTSHKERMLRLQRFIKNIKWYRIFKLVKTRAFVEWYYSPNNIGGIISKKRILNSISK